MKKQKFIFVMGMVISAVIGALIERATINRESASIAISDKEKSQNDIVTIIKEKNNKDGSSERETTIVDKSKATSERKEKIEVVKNDLPKDWMITGGMNNNNVYMLSVQRRILGPIFLGAYGDTNRTFGASIGIQF